MSETWIGLADAEVLAPDSAERLTVAKIKQRDDLAEICDQVMSQVRQAYELSNRDVGEAGTIPAGLKGRAVAIALWRFVSEGVPKLPAIQTKEREAAARAAGEYLDRIAAAEIGNASAPSVGKRHRVFGHRQENGI